MTEPNWAYVESEFVRRARNMQMPDWNRVENQFIEVAFQFQNSLHEAANKMGLEGERKALWALVLKLELKHLPGATDGAEYYYEYHNLIAFGKSPEAAMYAFEKLFTTGKK
jgi:hypothetical protein